MKLNIFRIPKGQYTELERHLRSKGLAQTQSLSQNGWEGSFLFSSNAPSVPIPWVKTFATFIGPGSYSNRSYFAVILFRGKSSCYAITFGKAHFYVRPYCDYDFGIELAKRIANDKDVAQTSTRKYQGKQKKDIRSFTGEMQLRIAPGSSVDFIQGRIVEDKKETFGRTAKFGTSCLLSPDINPNELGKLLSAIEESLAEEERFKLPRTIVLSDDDEIARYDRKLIDELMSPVGTSDIATNSFELYGVDFIFSSSGTFTLKCGNYAGVELDQLTMRNVKDYIRQNSIPRDKVLSLRITHHPEEGNEYSERIKEAVDYICDEDLVVLRGGKWLKFNEDYLEALDSAIRRIKVEETEEDLLEISLTEAEFNHRLSTYGYEIADKNFEILKTKGKAPSEAWDLAKGKTVYAVKFGTPQKLNYVVDQASSVLEIIHNRAHVHEPPPFENYCLWFGYRAKKLPTSLADSGSIILKQKVEAWARQCEETGFTPVLKLSRKRHAKYDRS